jgi:hypothetical protein
MVAPSNDQIRAWAIESDARYQKILGDLAKSKAAALVTQSAPPPTNFLSDFGTELVDQASFNVLDRPSGGGVGSTLGRIGGGFANAATLTGLLGLTGVAPELGVPAAAALAGLLGGGSLEARTQYNKSGTITDPGAVLGQGAVEGALNLIPGSKAASFLRRAAVDVPVQAGAGLVGDLASQGIRGQGFDLNEAVQSTAAGGGMGVFSALLGGPRPQTSRTPQVNVDVPPPASPKLLTGGIAPSSPIDQAQLLLTGRETPLLTGGRTYTTADGQSTFSVNPGPTPGAGTPTRLAGDGGIMLNRNNPALQYEDALFTPVSPDVPTGKPLQGEIVPDAPAAITPENATPMGFKLKPDGFVDQSSLNSPTAQVFNGKKSAIRAGEAFGLKRNEIVPVQVGKNEWAIHRIDAAEALKPQPVTDFIGLGPRPKVDSNPIPISTVLRESLSADLGAQDNLLAFDTLRDMGYDPKPLSIDEKTGLGKQFSIKIGDKLAVMRSGEPLSAFLQRNEIGFDNLARSMNTKKANIDRLVEMLPDSPAKNTFLENEMVLKQGRDAVKEFEALQNTNKKADAYLKQIDNAANEADLNAVGAAIDTDPDMVRLFEMSPTFGEELGLRQSSAIERIQRIANGEYVPPKGSPLAESANNPNIDQTTVPLSTPSTPATSAPAGIVKPPTLANVLRGLEPDQARTVYDVDLSQVAPGTKVEELKGIFRGFDEFGMPDIGRQFGAKRPGESGVAIDQDSLGKLLQKAKGVLQPEDEPMLQQLIQDIEAAQATEFVGRPKIGRSADLPESLATPGTLNAYGSKSLDRVMQIDYVPPSKTHQGKVVARVIDSNGNYADRIIREAGEPEVGFMRTGSKPEVPAHATPLQGGKRELVGQESLQNAASIRQAVQGTKYANDPIVQRIDAAVATNDAKGLNQALRDFSRLPKEVQKQMGVQAGCVK